ncbi:MAG: hypothetical protein ACTSU5_12760 [Promethearchaeota archaeon]
MTGGRKTPTAAARRRARRGAAERGKARGSKARKVSGATRTRVHNTDRRTRAMRRELRTVNYRTKAIQEGQRRQSRTLRRIEGNQRSRYLDFTFALIVTTMALPLIQTGGTGKIAGLCFISFGIILFLFIMGQFNNKKFLRKISHAQATIVLIEVLLLIMLEVKVG